MGLSLRDSGIEIKRRDQINRYDFVTEDDPSLQPTRFASKDYMDSFVNPPHLLKEEARKRESDLEKEKAKPLSLPAQPERDGIALATGSGMAISVFFPGN